jgi:hypothetical protein
VWWAFISARALANLDGRVATNSGTGCYRIGTNMRIGLDWAGVVMCQPRAMCFFESSWLGRTLRRFGFTRVGQIAFTFQGGEWI